MMNELMSRMAGSEIVEWCKKEPDANKEDVDSHNETFETAHGSSLESFKSADVVESPKPAVKEVEIFSSDDHSSNPEIGSSNENDTEEIEEPRGGGDAGTVAVVEKTKSVDCENLETKMTDLGNKPHQEVATEQKEVQTKLMVRSFLLLNFLYLFILESIGETHP